ncbi:ABC transporter substrate-binding protein [Paraburkholderia sp. CI3]|uniref:ABC transporter substrate-binding protein n=1 Tax=Paraburkholderia sp. CI3 TaxID=2991060 RepID=UPI003D213862
MFAIVVDPVGDDVVKSMQRPGENITGVTSFDPQQPRKQLELLKEVVPSLRRVAILADHGLSEPWLTAHEEQARALGLQPQRLLIAEPNPDLEGVFAAIRQAHADAVLMLQEPVVVAHSKEIAELAAKDRLPTMFPQSLGGSGALIAYGTSVGDALRREAMYVDKILKGAKPGELPVETVTRYELILNLKTARDIGATIPAELIKRADKMIQ